MDYEEFKKKREEALSNFPKSFIEQVQYDPNSRAVIECLSRSANPYELLYNVLMDNIALRKKIEELCLNQQPLIIISKQINGA